MLKWHIIMAYIVNDKTNVHNIYEVPDLLFLLMIIC